MSPHERDGAAVEQLRDAENMIQAAVDMLSSHLRYGLKSGEVEPLRRALRRALDDIQQARARLEASPGGGA